MLGKGLNILELSYLTDVTMQLNQGHTYTYYIYVN